MAATSAPSRCASPHSQKQNRGQFVYPHISSPKLSISYFVNPLNSYHSIPYSGNEYILFRRWIACWPTVRIVLIVELRIHGDEYGNAFGIDHNQSARRSTPGGDLRSLSHVGRRRRDGGANSFSVVTPTRMRLWRQRRTQPRQQRLEPGQLVRWKQRLELR